MLNKRKSQNLPLMYAEHPRHYHLFVICIILHHFISCLRHYSNHPDNFPHPLQNLKSLF